MAGDNALYVTLAVFYIVFIGLVGLQDIGIEYTESSIIDDIQDILDVIPVIGDLLSDFLGYLEQIFVTFNGFPTIVNIVFFSPVIALAVFWIIKFLIEALPFIGT